MRRPVPAARLAALPLLVAAPAMAQSISPLVLEGDAVAGVGNVSSVANLAVNSSGSWFVEADTDHADTDADSVLLKDGLLFLREGQMLTSPAGALLDSFDSVTIDEGGRGHFNHFLDGTAGTSDDSGAYRDGVLVVQESAASNAPQLTPGTPYIGFFDVKPDASGNLYTFASVDDVNIASGVDRVITRFVLDAGGAVLSESVKYKEGDVLPGQTEAVADFGTDPHESDVNEFGDVMYSADLTGDTAVDGVVYCETLLIAQEGSPSPVAGRNWFSLSSSKTGLNALGQAAYSGTLDGDSATNAVIVKDNAKVAQEGDSLAAFAPFALTSFGSGPVRIGNDGRVLWYGKWDDPDATVDEGLFLDDELIVQEGVTMVNGVVIETLRGITDGYALSRDGRYVIFEAVLADGREGAFLYDALGAPVGAYCFGDGAGTPCPCGNDAAGFGGCANSSGAGGVLVSSGTSSVTSDDLEFHATSLLTNQPALLFAGEIRLNGGDGISFGDGLRCAGMNVQRLGVDVPDGAGESDWGPGLAAQAGFLPGDERHFQAWYRDPAGSPCGFAFNLSNGFSVTFAP